MYNLILLHTVFIMKKTIISFKVNIHCNLHLECGATTVAGSEKKIHWPHVF